MFHLVEHEPTSVRFDKKQQVRAQKRVIFGAPETGENVLRLRSGPQWNACRRIVLARESVCWLCGRPVDFNAPPRSKWAPSVDHVYPLKHLRGLPETEQRRLAYDPDLCRLACYSCNSSAGQRRPALDAPYVLRAAMVTRSTIR